MRASTEHQNSQGHMRNPILQIVEVFRTSGLDASEALIIAAQLLAWTKLSADENIKHDLRLSALTGTADAVKFPDILHALEELPGLPGRAFAGLARTAKASPATFLQCIEVCIRLHQTGMLATIDMRDLATLYDSKHGASWALPAELADLMVALTAPVPGEVIYTPWDNGAQLASRIMQRSASAYIDISLNQPLAAAVALLGGGEAEIHHADPIREPSAVRDGQLQRFAAAVAAPPMGQRYESSISDNDWYGRFPESTGSGSVLCVRHLLAQSERRAVVLVSNNVLFSPGAELSLRKDLVSQGILEAVISLPSGVFPNISVAFAILVLSPQEKKTHIRFVNADCDRFRKASSKSRAELKNIHELVEIATSSETLAEAISISNEDVIANEFQLQVNRYVVPTRTQQVRQMLADTDLQSLGQLVRVVRPLLPSQRTEETMSAFEVSAADLPQYGFIQSAGREVQIDKKNANKNLDQFLRPLDIVLVIKGSAGKVGIVPPTVPQPGQGGWVAGQSAIILRMKDPSVLDPRALALLLRSPLGQELLQGVVSGATIPMIQVRELTTQLAIPVPTSLEAMQAVESLEQEANLQSEIDRLRAQQAAVTRDLWRVSTHDS